MEAADGGDLLRGGAFNCSDSERLHRCDFAGGLWASAKGFRCCADLVAPR